MEQSDKLSDIINQLQKLLTQYGDLPVKMDCDDQEWDIHSINYSEVYSDDLKVVESKHISLVSYD